MAKVDNKWIKDLTDLGGPGNENKLISTEKIYDPTVNKSLSEAILDGDIGGDGINYITNGEAKDSTTGWANYADTASESPEDGTGGSPSLTFITTTSDPLRGGESFLFPIASAASYQGEGISYDFTPDKADGGQLGEINFSYEVDSNYETGFLKVFLYDVTNSRLVSTTNPSIENKGPVGNHRSFFTFPAGSTSLRLIIHVSTTSTAGFALTFDTVKVGPLNRNSDVSNPAFLHSTRTSSQSLGTSSDIIYNVIEQDTGSNYNTSTGEFTVTEEGNYHIVASYQTNSVNLSTTQAINITVDVNASNKLRGTTSGNGSSTFYQVDVSGVLFLNEGDIVKIKSSSNVSISTTSGSDINYVMMTRVSGPEQTEINTTGRQVFFYGAGSTTGTAVDSVTDIDFTTVTDTHGAYSSGVFTAPEDGIYSISNATQFTAADNGNLFTYLNGSLHLLINRTYVEDRTQGAGTVVVEMNKGDTLSIRKTGGNSVIDNATNSTWCTIIKVAELPGTVQPTFTKWQTKILPSNHTTNNSDISGIQFNNITVGKTYRVSGLLMYSRSSSGSDLAVIEFRSGAGRTGSVYGSTIINIANGEFEGEAISTVFTADSSTLYFHASSFSSGTTLSGDGTKELSYITLEELPAHTEVDIW